jgi:glycerol-3-phosphate acyltransferase PlsY|tara:strand:- start:5701 stop:6291 length:591 start_codon:yes stop_codon:yes gene_type:complete
MLENMLNLESFSIIIILYLIGTIPFAILTSKIFDLPDPRTFGSKNPGATNVLRSGNKFAAFFTLAGDALKGFIPMIYMMSCDYEIYELYLISFTILIGHCFPVTLGFKGGKGVATSLGILLALSPLVAIMVIMTWAIIYYLFKISGVSALIGFLLLPFFMFLINSDSYMIMISFVNVIFIYLTHKKNILEFLSGQT